MQEVHAVVLTKPAMRNLRDEVIQRNAAAILESVNSKSLANRGWVVSAGIPTAQTPKFWSQRYTRDSDQTDAEYIFSMFLTITYDSHKDADSNVLASILRTLYTRAIRPPFGSWTLATVDGKDYILPADGEVSYSDDEVGYSDVEVPANFASYFSHLFGLDSHVARILGAIEAGQMSGWRNRFHCALQGPPGCGKSDLCRSLKAALGDDAVMEFDATATTAAGAIKELAEREILPRILIVEEIEKADEKALSFLLGVCDLRGEIRKTTARNTIQRDTKLLVIATVNDVPLFNLLNKTALASRFANKINFKRPTRDMRERILRREIEKVSGDIAWIKPTLDYCESNHIDDPRQIIALCLCGREMWLTGEYQSMLSDTAPQDDDTETVESPLSA